MAFPASVKYIFERTSRFSHTVDTWIQDFPALFNKVESISFKVGETDYFVWGLTYSPSTSAEGVTLPLVLGPEGTAACDVTGYDGLDVKGKIVRSCLSKEGHAQQVALLPGEFDQQNWRVRPM